MERSDKIYVAGHAGMIGTALIRRLREQGYGRVLTRTRAELDLLDQAAVTAFFSAERPDYVFLAAGKTGGIYANTTYRADYLYENLQMQCNVIHQSFIHEVRKLIFFACSSIYPRNCSQPLKEEHLLTGPLEPTNEPFAVAKIAGLKMCESYNRQYGTDFITVLPTNVYGPGQRYEPMNSPVIPSMILKFHAAKSRGDTMVSLWGSGRPARDFLYADDLADATIFVMDNYEGNVLLNVGTGVSRTIAEVAESIRREVGFEGRVEYDASLPDGMSTKIQDVSVINDLGWRYQVGLEEGIRRTYRDFLARVAGGEIPLALGDPIHTSVLP